MSMLMTLKDVHYSHTTLYQNDHRLSVTCRKLAFLLLQSRRVDLSDCLCAHHCRSLNKGVA